MPFRPNDPPKKKDADSTRASQQWYCKIDFVWKQNGYSYCKSLPQTFKEGPYVIGSLLCCQKTCLIVYNATAYKSTTLPSLIRREFIRDLFNSIKDKAMEANEAQSWTFSLEMDETNSFNSQAQSQNLA